MGVRERREGHPFRRQPGQTLRLPRVLDKFPLAANYFSCPAARLRELWRRRPPVTRSTQKRLAQATPTQLEGAGAQCRRWGLSSHAALDRIVCGPLAWQPRRCSQRQLMVHAAWLRSTLGASGPPSRLLALRWAAL